MKKATDSTVHRISRAQGKNMKEVTILAKRVFIWKNEFNI